MKVVDYKAVGRVHTPKANSHLKLLILIGSCWGGQPMVRMQCIITEIQIGCRSAISSKINGKTERIFPIAVVDNPTRFHENSWKTFLPNPVRGQMDGQRLMKT